ncbi:hypothetical protein PTSG_06769 [Salpingoeca rosetta]|uniref:Homologous-pairing protein 2 homolog n=1 Tax=Salpingoeca rosetta (strain ATCC 50818 / BSB-021) TaxID=946362 RepID=F2UER4_SALR5|nr:uncharacterized protein PTSG_06769 [Salpingoeca rosetta]EGD75114.1 hypothetical protein PTSG_06769 [Salpingoeca rosetta]|eukprot:XP_004992167.1 hypothetical protein PTSG_06769 [Salpingoeca rosetta]
MPPKAKKPKQIKDEDEAAKVLLEYLTRQNRPYNANDLFMNLHKAIGKTALTRVLAKMAADGQITEKVFGKQKIYFPLQSEFPKLSKEELTALDKELEELKAEMKGLQSECDQLQSKLSSTLATPETADAEKALTEVQERNEKKEGKLKALRSDGKSVTEADKNKINKKFDEAVKLWRRRKRMATDILDQILESYPKPKKALFNDIGLETDEEVKVNLKDFGR